MIDVLIETRYKTILELLSENASIKVTDLADRFGVSIETIRRDLQHLESAGLLKRVHGGAVSIPEKKNASDDPYWTSDYWQEKQEIGRIVCKHLQNGQIISMDASTTNLAIAQHIKQHFDNLTVITNYIPIIAALADCKGITIIAPGEILRRDERAGVGQRTIESFASLHANIALLSICGVSLAKGLTDFSLDEIYVKRAMLKAADVKYIVADSRKIEKTALLKVCDFEEIDGIFTDSKLSPEIKAQYEAKGIRLINEIN